MQQTGGNSAAPKRRVSLTGVVAQVPSAGAMQASLPVPHDVTAWDQAPLLVRVSFTVHIVLH